jgi:hypothetical protein
MAKTKFPKSAERSQAKPAAICPAERVLKLYNEANEDTEAKRISKKVREWFEAEAHADGWDVVGFVPEVQSLHGAGAVLIKNFKGVSASATLRAIGSDD